MNDNLNNQVPGQVPTQPVQPQPIPQQPMMQPQQPVQPQAPVQPQTQQQYATPTIQTQQQRDERIHMARAVVTEETKQEQDEKSIEQQLSVDPQLNANVNGQPQIAAVTPAPAPEITTEVAKDNILDSITLEGEDNEQSGDAESVTFDYDSIYGNNGEVKDIEVQEEDTNKPVFTATDLDIQNRDLRDRTKTDIAPSFNINALDSSATGEDAKEQGNILSEKQQDRADTRRRIMFILGLVLILIIAVKVVFPLLMK